MSWFYRGSHYCDNQSQAITYFDLILCHKQSQDSENVEQMETVSKHKNKGT